MSNLVYSRKMVAFKEFFQGGKEYWFFSGTNQTQKEIFHEVSEIADIYVMERLSDIVCFNIFSSIGSRMSNQSENLLEYLVQNRYFEPRRGKSLQEIAKEISISKSNLSRKVRQIERFLAHEYIRKTKIINFLDKDKIQIEKEY